MPLLSNETVALSALSGATGENAERRRPVHDVGAVDLERLGGDRVVVEGRAQREAPEAVRRGEVRVQRAEIVGLAAARHDVRAGQPQRARHVEPRRRPRVGRVGEILKEGGIRGDVLVVGRHELIEEARRDPVLRAVANVVARIGDRVDVESDAVQFAALPLRQRDDVLPGEQPVIVPERAARRGPELGLVRLNARQRMRRRVGPLEFEDVVRRPQARCVADRSVRIRLTGIRRGRTVERTDRLARVRRAVLLVGAEAV